MTSLGVKRELSTASMGEEMARGEDESGWAQDRRVEFKKSDVARASSYAVALITSLSGCFFGPRGRGRRLRTDSTRKRPYRRLEHAQNASSSS